MLRLIQFLIFGHVHKWQVIEKGTFRTTDGYTQNPNAIVKTGVRYSCRCDKCGVIRKFDV